VPTDQEVATRMAYLVDEASMTIQILIDQAVDKAVVDIESLVATMKRSGASDDAIRHVLLNDLESGGRIFGSFKNQFKATADYGIGKMSHIGSVHEMGSAGLRIFKWQSAGKNICPDCKGRHGQEMSYEEWSLFGLPKSGFSVCGSYCNCDLVPTGQWQKDPLKIPLEGEGMKRRQVKSSPLTQTRG